VGNQGARCFGRCRHLRIAAIASNLIPADLGLRSQIVQRSDKSVPTAVESLDVLRIFSVIVERLAELLHGTVEAQIEIDEHVGRPESFLQFFPAHHSPGRSSNMAKI